MNEILNEALKVEDLPGAGATWREIEVFALTFDGYRRVGPSLGELAQRHREAGTVPADLSELRGILFLQQRSWRHVMDVPDEAGMRFIWALIAGIRRVIEER